MKNIELAAKKEKACMERWEADDAIKRAAEKAATRPPAPGDTVNLVGLRRRPQFNGNFGEVLSAEPDADGYVLVSVPRPPVSGDGASSTDMGRKKLRVQHRCLVLTQNRSSPTLQQGGACALRDSSLASPPRSAGSSGSTSGVRLHSPGGVTATGTRQCHFRSRPAELKASISSPDLGIGSCTSPSMRLANGPTLSHTGVWQVALPGKRTLGWAGH